MSSMNRRMTRADINDVVELDKKLFNESFSKKSLVALYMHPSTEAFTLEVEDVIVGYIMASKDMFTAEIVRIGVMPQFQGNGYARELIGRLADHIGPDMSVEIRVDNEADAFFAQRCDFHVVAEYGDGIFLFRRGWRMGSPPQLKFRIQGMK